jgi:hypothetical protein
MMHGPMNVKFSSLVVFKFWLWLIKVNLGIRVFWDLMLC